MQEEDDAVAAAAIASFDVKDFLSMGLQIPAPKPLQPPERNALVKSSIARIWYAAHDDIAAPPSKSGPLDMWMLLLIRLVTRGADPGEKPDAKGKAREEGGEADESEDVAAALARYEKQDRLRGVLCEYIMADFAGR